MSLWVDCSVLPLLLFQGQLRKATLMVCTITVSLVALLVLRPPLSRTSAVYALPTVKMAPGAHHTSAAFHRPTQSEHLLMRASGSADEDPPLPPQLLRPLVGFTGSTADAAALKARNEGQVCNAQGFCPCTYPCAHGCLCPCPYCYLYLWL